MPWVYFHRDFDYRIAPRAVTHCRGGTRVLVKLEVAEAAIASGAGVMIDRPPGEPPVVATSRRKGGRKNGR